MHNIIIAEEGSELHIITGCASKHEIEMGLHLGVSEFYVKKNAKTTFTMVHNWAEGMDVRPRSAEIISRAITKGGRIVARGHLKGEVEGIKAHLECHGLILDEGGSIYAVPELEGSNPDVDMSHEAAVGKIAREEVEYLMSRGLSEEEATSTIVRGFLNVKIEGLPPILERELQKMTELSERSAL